MEFQSALPLRGATGVTVWRDPDNIGFQSALPLRGATEGRYPYTARRFISIRAPLAGSDIGITPPGKWRWISIRAPLAGSDFRALRRSPKFIDFNPRSPCGERPRFSASPCGGPQFQSALPLRGATSCASRTLPQVPYFNPRSPCGERPLYFVASIYYQQSVVFSKTVAANSVDKLRKTTAKSAITRCEAHS